MTSNNKSIKPRALTDNDIKWFFEALGEYGKDFNNIHNYITQRSGKAGLPADQIRSREQIRNFYNRLYNRLSQLITITNDVDKVTQELYLLINYGEIWKKFGFKFNTRTRQLLNGLVNDGHTTYKMKKGYIRFRTPSCKALRRLHEISVDDKLIVLTSSEVPKDIVVEFYPATNRDWLKVQSISHNPRIRSKLSLQKRVSSVINYLEDKWGLKNSKILKCTDQWLKLSQQTRIVDEISSVQNENPSVPSMDPVIRSIRLRPSKKFHDLTATTVTRVVPDCQMNLSLQAYLSKMPGYKDHNSNKSGAVSNSSSGSGKSNASTNQPSASNRSSIGETHQLGSKEDRSCTSEPIEQAQKQLSVLQTMLASIDGCENSRTNCEDTFDRIRGPIAPVHEPEPESILVNDGLADYSPMTTLVQPIIPENSLQQTSMQQTPRTPMRFSESSRSNLARLYDDNATQSVDLPMPPPNMTIAEWFERFNHASNDGHINTPIDPGPTLSTSSNNQQSNGPLVNSASPGTSNTKDQPQQPEMIDPKKFSSGWTANDDASITIGELYLAFRCPEKIVLDYEFEVANKNSGTAQQIDGQNVQDPIGDSFLYKLVTTASVALARVQNVSNRAGGVSGISKESANVARVPKRRKIVPTTISRTVSRQDSLSSSSELNGLATCGNPVTCTTPIQTPTPIQPSIQIQTTTSQFNITNTGPVNVSRPAPKSDSRMASISSGLSEDDIELRNQKVEEVLKQLQPTRLTYRSRPF